MQLLRCLRTGRVYPQLLHAKRSVSRSRAEISSRSFVDPNVVHLIAPSKSNMLTDSKARYCCESEQNRNRGRTSRSAATLRPWDRWQFAGFNHLAHIRLRANRGTEQAEQGVWHPVRIDYSRDREDRESSSITKSLPARPPTPGPRAFMVCESHVGPGLAPPPALQKWTTLKSRFLPSCRVGSFCAAPFNPRQHSPDPPAIACTK